MRVQLRAFFFNILEAIRVFFKYYRPSRFVLADLYLSGCYFFVSPFAISKKYLKKKREKNLYQYGPTPLTTYDRIAQECQILSKDTLYELGSGTGRGALWLSHFVGCKTVGIERIAAFVNHANKAAHLAHLSRATFCNTDFFATNYQQATVLYLYGTLLTDAEIDTLCHHLKELKPNTKVITVSYPLTDYAPNTFTLKKTFHAHFPWGPATLFLNLRTP